MVRQRAHRVGVQNVQNLFQDFFPRQFAACQQNAHVYFSRLRGRCFHVCNQRRRGFCEILIPAQRSRRGIGFYALPHTLIERRVAFPVCAACALRDVLDAFVVGENVYRLVDLSGDKSVSAFALRLALRFHAPGPLSRRNCQVLQRSEHDFTVRRGPRACRNGRCHFQRDRKRISQGRSGLFRLQPLRALEQFCEGIQIFALCIPRDILFRGKVDVHPLLNDNIGNPQNEQPRRVRRVQRAPGDFFVPLYQRIHDCFRVGFDVGNVGVCSTLRCQRYSPPIRGPAGPAFRPLQT